MIEKIFTDPRGRDIVIRVTDDAISFYHLDNIERQREWVAQQIENGYEVDEEAKHVDEFYWIDKKDWIDDVTQRQDRGDNWHTHMREKTWFTNRMYDFINEATGVCIR